MSTSNNEGLDEYEWADDADHVAESRGLIAVLPASNQIQIDIDSEEQFREYQRRYEGFETSWNSHEVEVKPSRSGLPNRHVTITFAYREFNNHERIALQAALNDDPLRVFLNMLRLENGIANPSRLFEKPEEGIF